MCVISDTKCCVILLQLDVLREVAETAEGRVEVYMDGGVRLGTDVFKALALGARAVFIGRPIPWGLTYKVIMDHSTTSV